MSQVKWNSNQRLLILISGVLFLPALILLAWTLTMGLLSAQSRVEDKALTTAAEIVSKADYRLAVYEGILGTYSTAASLADRDWGTSRSRALDVLELSPGLTRLLVIENVSGLVVMDTRDSSSRTSLPRLISGDPRPAVMRAGDGCPCVVVSHPIRRLPGHSVVGYVRPEIFQAALLRSHQSGSVAALVDADGDFVARSLDFPARVGTPATIYVRSAVARGGEASTVDEPTRV